MPNYGEEQLEEPDIDREHKRFLGILVGIVVISIWIRPIFSGLWLDELGTWWVVKNGFGDTVHRAWTYQGQSPLYYSIEWLIRVAGGRSEMMLRLPSLIAGAGAAFLFFRLVDYLLDRETARLALLAFVATQVIAMSSSEARPYGLGLLAVVAATYALVRWLDSGGWRLAATYALLAGLTVWCHYLLGWGLVAHAVYSIARVRAGTTRVRLRSLITAAIAISLLVLPLVLQVLSLWSRRASLSIPAAPSIDRLWLLLVPPVAAAALLIGGLLARARGPLTVRGVVAKPQTMSLLVSMFLLPPVSVYLLSIFTPIRLLAAYYVLPSMLAGAALLAWAIRMIEPAFARRLIAAVLAILAVLSYGSPLMAGEDWRGAALYVSAHASQSTVVLVHPALVESAQLSWLSNPEQRSYLLSPLSYYPMPGQIVLLPYLLTPSTETYLEGIVSHQLAGVDRFLLVTRYPFVPYQAWLDGQLAATGMTSRVVGTFGVIKVIEFTRSS